MFNLIDQVLVSATGSQKNAASLCERLEKIGLAPKLATWNASQVLNEESPQIFLDADQTTLRDHLLELGARNYTCLIVSPNDEDAALHLYFDASKRLIERRLHLVDAVSALVQTYVQLGHCQQNTSLSPWQNSMIGGSDEFENMLRLADKIACTDCDVLIQGETGTGKELVARLVHYQSQRRDNPFIPVNCGAFSDELLLSELFGHTKGAFTGAMSNRIGLIEQAQHGTIFLDEIDSLSSKAQVAILRYLQNREVRPQGSNDLKICDTRVVAACNQSLTALVKKNKFREDLMFRLDVLHLDLPPLRKRGDDVYLLIQHFFDEAAREYKLSNKVCSPRLISALAAYEWPGNIRELQNIVYRLFLLSEQFMIRTDFAKNVCGLGWLDDYLDHRNDQGVGGMQNEKNLVIERFERSYLRRVLQKSRGNVSKAAKLACKERRSFMRLMKKYDLERSQFLPR